jgi:predicted O-methyltransferase YrrM
VKRIDTEYVISLYQKYLRDLKAVRLQQQDLYAQKGYYWYERNRACRAIRFALKRLGIVFPSKSGMKPQLDDIEAEITYMLIREYQPETVVEISPCGGWSTAWILHALKDNGLGMLHSYDLINESTKNVPPELSSGRWIFSLGDVTKAVDRIPQSIDYLFIDSDHSAQFAEWYIRNVFPRLKTGNPVSVHDVYHTSSPSSHGSEGALIAQWLQEREIDYFTTARAKSPANFRKLMSEKKRLGIDKPIQRTRSNPMIFFLNRV